MPLTLDKFKYGVERCGGSITHFNDGDQLKNSTNLQNRDNAVIAAVWIRNQKLVNDHNPVPGSEQCIEEISWMAEQRSKGKSRVLDQYLQAYGLRTSAGRYMFTRELKFDKNSFLINTPASYFLLDNNGDGGNGVAFSTINGNRFFDPNIGTAKFKYPYSIFFFFKKYWLPLYPELISHSVLQRYN